MFSLVRRVLLFLLTNIAVIALLSVVLHVLGVDRMVGPGQFGGLLLFSAIFGFAGSFISLAMSKWIAKRSTGARVIDQPQSEVEAWLVSTVEKLARQIGIGTPEVAIYPSEEPNAFATGMSRDSALVAVSVGLLRQMDRREVEAVLGHELSHVANGDMVTLSLLQGVVNTFVIFLSRVIGFVVDKAVFRTERGWGPGYFVTVLISQVVLGLFATMIVMAFSRWREFRADAGSARLLGPAAMIDALRALKTPAAARLPESLQAFAIRDSGARGLMARLFRSHPDIDERIARLKRLQAE